MNDEKATLKKSLSILKKHGGYRQPLCFFSELLGWDEAIMLDYLASLYVSFYENAHVDDEGTRWIYKPARDLEAYMRSGKDKTRAIRRRLEEANLIKTKVSHSGGNNKKRMMFSINTNEIEALHFSVQNKKVKEENPHHLSKVKEENPHQLSRVKEENPPQLFFAPSLGTRQRNNKETEKQHRSDPNSKTKKTISKKQTNETENKTNRSGKTSFESKTSKKTKQKNETKNKHCDPNSKEKPDFKGQQAAYNRLKDSDNAIAYQTRENQMTGILEGLSGEGKSDNIEPQKTLGSFVFDGFDTPRNKDKKKVQTKQRLLGFTSEASGEAKAERRGESRQNKMFRHFVDSLNVEMTNRGLKKKKLRATADAARRIKKWQSADPENTIKKLESLAVGLARSDWHVENGFVSLAVALKESNEDRFLAVSRKPQQQREATPEEAALRAQREIEIARKKRQLKKHFEEIGDLRGSEIVSEMRLPDFKKAFFKVFGVAA